MCSDGHMEKGGDSDLVIMENKTKLNLLEERKTQLERTGFVKSIESKTIEELDAEITNLKSLIPVEIEEDLVNNEEV